MADETEWGYWLGGKWIRLPKRPLELAGYKQPPFDVTRPDGKVVRVVERSNDA